jgi:hypothetical protein
MILYFNKRKYTSEQLPDLRLALAVWASEGLAKRQRRDYWRRKANRGKARRVQRDRRWK